MYCGETLDCAPARTRPAAALGTARTRPAAALGTARPPSPEHEGGAPARVDRMSGVLVLGLAAVFAAGFAGGEECPLPPDVVFPGARAVPDVPRDLMQGGGAVDWGEAFVRRRPFVVRNAEFASRWNALKHWGDPKYVADRWPKLKVHATTGHCSDAVVRAAVRETT